MKAKKLAACGVLLPLFLLCACGGGSSGLTVTANWYRDTTKRAVTLVSERLSYEVVGEPDPKSTYDLKTSYNGTYTTVLGTESKTVGGQTELVYSLTATTDLAGVFELNGKTHEFRKLIESKVWFRGVENSLRPVAGEKYVKDTLPVVNADDIANAYREYEYTQKVDYNDEFNRAVLTLDYADPAITDFEKEIKLSGSSSFFDNEEILFALRGLDLGTDASFRTVDFARRKQINVGLTAKSVTEGVKRTFAIGDAEKAEHELDVAAVEIAYSGSNAGYPLTLEYARTTDEYANEYRNVLLYAEQTAIYGLCTLKYTLTGATFSNV